MTRNKVKMAYIPSDIARKASFRTRRQGLMKKMEELNTLCDIQSFLIIYGPKERELTVWPSQAVVEKLLEQYLNVSDVERGRKMMDHKNYLRDRITKSQELLAKHARRNRELQAYKFMNELQWTGKQLTDFSSGDLNEIVWFTEVKRREVTKRRNLSLYVAGAAGPSTPPALDHLAPPSNPELEIYLLQAGIRGEDEGIDVPESSPRRDKPEAEASGSRPPGVSSGMEDLLFIPPGSGVDTGAGLINNHNALAWDWWLSSQMNAIPKAQNIPCNTSSLVGAEILWAPAPPQAANVYGAECADPNVVLAINDMLVASSVVPEMVPVRADIRVIERRDQSLGLAIGNGMGGGDGLQNMGVELSHEVARGTPIPGDNESDYAFVLQKGDIGGRDMVQAHHQAGSEDHASVRDGFVLPQLNFEDHSYLQNSMFMALQSNVMNGGTGGGNSNTIDVEPTNNPWSNVEWPFYP